MAFSTEPMGPGSEASLLPNVETMQTLVSLLYGLKYTSSQGKLKLLFLKTLLHFIKLRLRGFKYVSNNIKRFCDRKFNEKYINTRLVMCYF